MGFELTGDANIPYINSPRGVTVTDLKWRAKGRIWLEGRERALTLDHGQLLARLEADAIYLAVGLSRPWQGKHWPLVIGVHTVPDYTWEPNDGLSA